MKDPGPAALETFLRISRNQKYSFSPPIIVDKILKVCIVFLQPSSIFTLDSFCFHKTLFLEPWKRWSRKVILNEVESAEETRKEAQ